MDNYVHSLTYDSDLGKITIKNKDTTILGEIEVDKGISYRDVINHPTIYDTYVDSIVNSQNGSFIIKGEDTYIKKYNTPMLIKNNSSRDTAIVIDAPTGVAGKLHIVDDLSYVNVTGEDTAIDVFTLNGTLELNKYSIMEELSVTQVHANSLGYVYFKYGNVFGKDRSNKIMQHVIHNSENTQEKLIILDDTILTLEGNKLYLPLTDIVFTFDKDIFAYNICDFKLYTILSDGNLVVTSINTLGTLYEVELNLDIETFDLLSMSVLRNTLFLFEANKVTTINLKSKSVNVCSFNIDVDALTLTKYGELVYVVDKVAYIHQLIESNNVTRSIYDMLKDTDCSEGFRNEFLYNENIYQEVDNFGDTSIGDIEVNLNRFIVTVDNTYDGLIKRYPLSEGLIDNMESDSTLQIIPNINGFYFKCCTSLGDMLLTASHDKIIYKIDIPTMTQIGQVDVSNLVSGDSILSMDSLGTTVYILTSDGVVHMLNDLLTDVIKAVSIPVVTPNSQIVVLDSYRVIVTSLVNGFDVVLAVSSARILRYFTVETRNMRITASLGVLFKFNILTNKLTTHMQEDFIKELV